jgi:hypothetical protein
MAILDFLKTKKGSPAAQIGELEKNLERVRAERVDAEKAVEAYAPRRAQMLLSDVDEATIIAADREAEVAKIRAERLELAELELLDRLEKAREAASRDAIDKERQAAEEKVAAGVRALEEYTAAAEHIRDLIGLVVAGERAAEAFNRNHSEELQLNGPEFRARFLPAAPRKILKDERVELWTYSSTGHIIPEEHVGRIHRSGPKTGTISSEGITSHSSHVELRQFRRISFTPEYRAALPKPLAESVVLPALTPDKQAIFNGGAYFGPARPLTPEIEVELLPLTDDAGEAAA